MLGGMPVDDAPENHSPSGQFVGRHSILETPVSWATMNVTTLGILDWHNRTMERFVSWGADGTPWINIGDPLSGMLATVVAERRTVRGDNPGGDPARVNLPWRHPIIQAFLASPLASPSDVYASWEMKDGPSAKTTKTWPWPCRGGSAGSMKPAICIGSRVRSATGPNDTWTAVTSSCWR
jgi:hypothetical protein